MSLPVTFLRIARVEFDNAANWYEQRRSGLGAAFTASVDRVLDRISQQPHFYGQAYKDVREALVPRYPYCVYYRIEDAGILVLSVFHTARDPSVWQERA